MIEQLITDVLKAEGWDKYTNHPADKGGPTKWGITQKKWSEYVGFHATAEDIQGITETGAREFYHKLYIIEPQFDQLPQLLIPLVVDSGVNSGPKRASKWVQRAVGARQDGKIGPNTLTAVRDSNHIAIFLKVVSFRCKLYGRLVSRDPKLKAAKGAGFRLQAEFAAGWNNRVMGFLERLAEAIN